MARYIDADKIFPNGVFYVNCNDPNTSLTELINRISSIPTADVVEVKHSKWVVTAYDNQDNILVVDYIKHQHSMPYCLNCKGDALLDGGEEYVTSDYCPNCGAKMDGGKDINVPTTKINHNSLCETETYRVGGMEE